MLQYSHRGLSKQSYNSLTPENPIVNGKLVPNIRNGTLKNEYPSPETILPGEVMPGRRHRRSGRAYQGEENAVLVKHGRRAGPGMVHGQTDLKRQFLQKRPPNCCNSSAACRVSENTA